MVTRSWNHGKVWTENRPFGSLEVVTYLWLPDICGNFCGSSALGSYSSYWSTERKTEWEVTMRRTAESRGCGRVSFTVSRSFLDTSWCGCFFLGGFGFVGFVFAVFVGLWYPGFLQITA